MNGQLFLDKPRGCFTNLDVVSGKVVLHVPTIANVTSVTVKLEGESRTRLVGPPPLLNQPGARRDRGDKDRTSLEIHKILYKAITVWPPPQLQDLGGKAAYTLNSGAYEWPFQFKIPFNNQCWNEPATKNVNFGGLQLEVLRQQERHAKQTLPPSINGFPGEAEIRYYVKVTVNRPQFYKENLRIVNHFTFLPIEPPRIRGEGEAYARRQHQFLPDPEGPAMGVRKKSLLGSMLGKSSTPTTPVSPISPIPPEFPVDRPPPPRFSVDARLPNPAVLTCNDTLPLKILVKQLSARKSSLYLQSLHIELVGFTKVRAHDLNRTENNVWVIASMSNMAIPLGTITDEIGTETQINSEYWAGNKLPASVAPSFETCNMARSYELEVRVGLGYASYEHGKDQLVVLPLRMPVKVFSGIAPPQSLIDRMGSDPTHLQGNVKTGEISTHPPLPVRPAHSVESGPSSASVAPPAYTDAPPSYEDAIAADMPPIDGPRRDYQPPPFTHDPNFPSDGKH